MTAEGPPLTALPASAPIATATTLDRRHLHVFVAGPGEGEAIAMALPTAGWVLVDSCRAGDGNASLVDVLDRWRTADEPILAYLLTHPHSDHARGVVELVERYGAVIRTVAVTPPWRAPDGNDSVSSRRYLARQVQKALAALERASKAGARSIDLVEGGDRLCAHDLVALRVCAPRREDCTRNVEDLNELSAVVEVTFGKTRLVLGSDLPKRCRARAGAGWEGVLERHMRLGQHALLKVPHHGSATSHHAPLFTVEARPRAWAITPYNRSHLPELVRLDGLQWILARNQPAHLTSPPVSKMVQVPVAHPAVVRLAELRERTDVNPTGIPLLDARAVESTPRAIASADSLWCFALDDAANIVGRWRGDAALEVLR